MSTESFQIAYDGESVRQGSMDIHELAPALLGIGDLIREANLILNGERAAVSTKVESDFKTGSFEISLIVDQNLIEQAKNYILGSGIADAAALIRFLFGGGAAVGVLAGVIKIYRALQGEKAKEITIVDNSTHTTIIQTESGKVIQNVDSNSARLYRSNEIKQAVRRAIKPLEQPGIDELQVKRNAETVERISKEDIPLFVGTESLGEELTNVRELFLKIEKLSFIPGQSWRFSDGTASFNAKIEDPEFHKRLEERREGFFSGDRLHVRLRTVQWTDEQGKLRSHYIIEKVLDHSPAPQQKRLE